jgi:hypothetical protein
MLSLRCPCDVSLRGCRRGIACLLQGIQRNAVVRGQREAACLNSPLKGATRDTAATCGV